MSSKKPITFDQRSNRRVTPLGSSTLTSAFSSLDKNRPVIRFQKKKSSSSSSSPLANAPFKLNGRGSKQLLASQQQQISSSSSQEEHKHVMYTASTGKKRNGPVIKQSCFASVVSVQEDGTWLNPMHPSSHDPSLLVNWEGVLWFVDSNGKELKDAQMTQELGGWRVVVTKEVKEFIKCCSNQRNANSMSLSYKNSSILGTSSSRRETDTVSDRSAVSFCSDTSANSEASLFPLLDNNSSETSEEGSTSDIHVPTTHNDEDGNERAVHIDKIMSTSGETRASQHDMPGKSSERSSGSTRSSSSSSRDRQREVPISAQVSPAIGSNLEGGTALYAAMGTYNSSNANNISNNTSANHIASSSDQLARPPMPRHRTAASPGMGAILPGNLNYIGKSNSNNTAAGICTLQHEPPFPLNTMDNNSTLLASTSSSQSEMEGNEGLMTNPSPALSVDRENKNLTLGDLPSKYQSRFLKANKNQAKLTVTIDNRDDTSSIGSGSGHNTPLQETIFRTELESENSTPAIDEMLNTALNGATSNNSNHTNTAENGTLPQFMNSRVNGQPLSRNTTPSPQPFAVLPGVPQKPARFETTHYVSGISGIDSIGQTEIPGLCGAEVEQSELGSDDDEIISDISAEREDILNDDSFYANDELLRKRPNPESVSDDDHLLARKRSRSLV